MPNTRSADGQGKESDGERRSGFDPAVRSPQGTGNARGAQVHGLGILAQNFDEMKALMFDFGSERNAFARQCLSYWDMAAAMVLHGAVDENLFFATNNEPYFLFAKFGQFLPQLRKEYVSADFLMHLETLANRPQGKQRVKSLQAR